MEETASRSCPDTTACRRTLASSASPSSASAGLTDTSSACPASVRLTLRVVRSTRATPSDCSSLAMVWLTAERVTPSCSAAAVKLRQSATRWNTPRALRSMAIG
ncbi:hypothetical protein G6F35_015255 [Rhizopus arrhizus]|nr:hypothetical protein G6F24_017653 [Rhizopus arrhizus]KAG1183795.1 hypothetical protein G6F35_015255 [Rhizopus arrhizus]